jgi:hypothetical protein
LDVLERVDIDDSSRNPDFRRGKRVCWKVLADVKEWYTSGFPNLVGEGKEHLPDRVMVVVVGVDVVCVLMTGEAAGRWES